MRPGVRTLPLLRRRRPAAAAAASRCWAGVWRGGIAWGAGAEHGGVLVGAGDLDLVAGGASLCLLIGKLAISGPFVSYQILPNNNLIY